MTRSRRLGKNQVDRRHGSGRPGLGRNFRLFEDDLRGPLLLVGRIALFAQDALDEDAELGADILAHCPVDRDVLADGRDQFSCDKIERGLAEHVQKYRAEYGREPSESWIRDHVARILPPGYRKGR